MVANNCCNSNSTDLAAKRPPTTPNIRDIFIGRCYEDEQCLQQDQCLNSTLNGTCEELWEIFNASFAFKDPCQAGDNTYDQLIATAPPSTMKDQTLFWSGLPSLALNNGRVTRRHTILEETLIGYAVNGLTWCGQLDNPGINYVGCPRGPNCTAETMYTFWRAASRAFARQARGIVKVALNGSRVDAFRNTSTFATTELRNLNRGYISHVNILLVYDITIPGDNKRARCNEGSIYQLQMLLTSYGFSYTCVENPSDFRYLQCASDPTNDHCKPNLASLTTSSSVVLALMLMVHKWI
ncbi:ADP-ribosyl cyclase/cyclic ADP-ribose hydrolase-like [Asterias rubens]|uniref:ADP-ribosyl cyclase/cyclic ADP-ribose hydrolase-like n=1 Tax=Asterias rubens TaxID=7604 RepID=UPI0014550445|nr:ADP-ribosyl cyclase/cyclic ADP-ribose hydrolase-like [Asterias rubens]